jgi:hypothetical protein
MIFIFQRSRIHFFTMTSSKKTSHILPKKKKIISLHENHTSSSISKDFLKLSPDSQTFFLQSLSSFFPLFPTRKSYLLQHFQSLIHPQPYRVYIHPNQDIKSICDKNHLPSTFSSFLLKNHTHQSFPFSKHQIQPLCNLQIVIEDIDIIKNYQNIVILTDSFQYENRLQCKLLSQKNTPHHLIQNSLVSFYRKYFTQMNSIYEKGIILEKVNLDMIIEKMKLKKFGKKDFEKIIHPLLFQYLLEHEKIKLCTLYKSYLMKLWIQIFDAKYILDLSSGWGDRLLGALAVQNSIEKYIGIDPNENLQKGYQEMIKTFCLSKNKHKFQMIVKGSQDVSYSTMNIMFDFIFWSPPFFDLEDYVPNQKDKSHINQSIQLFKNYEDWENKFIIKTIFESTLSMKKYGIFLFYIGHVKDSLFQKLNQIPHLRHLGSFYVTSYSKKQPKSYLVYQKI